MARRRSNIGHRKPRKIGTEELKRTKYSTMANCGQVDAPRFGFKSTKYGKLDVCVFYAKFAAKMFLDLMIEDDDVEWLDDNTIRTSQDVIIISQQLRKIYDHKVTYDQERYYKLDESHQSRALIIRSDDQAKAFIPGEDPTSRRRTSRKGMFLMKTIAEELGITPREARGILRTKMKKPQHGWAWRTAEEVQKIKSILKGTLITVDFSTCKETS
jgi:hypothetical protein